MKYILFFSAKMDTSANATGSSVPMKEISLKELQTSVIFPESNYLCGVNAELKKLMKERYV